MRKISIFGAGRVGESTAQLLAAGELAHEVVMIDVREGAAEGAALDIQEAAPLFGFDTRVVGSDNVAYINDSDLVIVTAGSPRKPGMSRSDVLAANVGVMESVVDAILNYAPQAIVIMVTNPVDVLTYWVRRRTGWDSQRVFGLSGVLDSARMASFIALETGFSVKDINAMVLGGHGDAMVPLPRFSTINGIPIEHFVSQAALERIVERTRGGGAEILALKQTSSANDSPAAAIATMVGAVAQDRKRLLPCVAYLDGEYGQRDLYLGVPAILGKDGLEKVVELPLADDEASQLHASAEQVRADLEHINEVPSR